MGLTSSIIFDITFTFQEFTILAIFSLVALAGNFYYRMYKKEDNLRELGVATIAAEIFILCFWLGLCYLYNT